MKKTIFLLALSMFFMGQGQEKNQDLADKLANPVASMISVPISSSLDIGVGPYKGSRMISNLQPVIPIRISNKWEVITRTILPFIDEKNIIGYGHSSFGLGDINFSAFFSPKDSKGLVWGLGPAIVLPTATERFLGARKWSTGPTVVFLKQKHGQTFGILGRQLWSFAGPNGREDVSELYLQPFYTYNFKSGAGLSTGMELTQDWKSGYFSGYLNFTGSMISTFGKQPVSFALGPRIPINSHAGGDWGLRVAITLIFK
ncbi:MULTISPECIES: hypothetical protein [Elizabethkingia]|uniref:Transporter n=1 Tax=Elizabethkingia ursingii TaxID=1756150 RepID=A0AAJ3NEF1_9FLAO|nr:MULTISPECIES: hypothetical protein [Elizabethkingia]AQW92904.1 hypothetical protein BBD30_01185 [Elizabethkingia anophelis]AQX09806.1 hypothetical protein BBD34_14685 [Elizabethkingia ursingii]OPB60823.1 hypothetical protein BAS07_17570 [Elizabethkingia anophelis]OPB78941.1 hypothetical protein BAY32_18970 [Elizabethkingia ursingii]OPB91627.1 hypothetical protein BB021_17090 [Elizabethkingia ursingii]